MRHSKVITNDDLAQEYQPSAQMAAPSPPQESSVQPAELPNWQRYRVPPDAATEPEQPGPPPGFFVISGHNLDLQYVKPGQQGLYVGIPRLETAPPSPQAVERQIQANIQARMSPPENPIQPTDSPPVIEAKSELASALVDLDFAERLLALDQDAYYSHPNFGDSRYDAEKQRIEAGQQDVAILRAEVERLRARLAALEAAQQAGVLPPQP